MTETLPAGLLMLAAAVLAALVLFAGWHAWRQARRRRALRRQKARELVAALYAYSSWVDEQHMVAFSTSDPHPDNGMLETARELKRAYFPELSREMVEVLIVHAALLDFLWNQQILQLRGSPGGKATDRDTHYRQLHARHRRAVGNMVARCLAHVGEARSGQDRERRFVPKTRPGDL